MRVWAADLWAAFCSSAVSPPRDLRRRPAQALVLLLAIGAATTVLTLGLVLRGVASHPYQQTRAATNGPDVVATVAPGGPNITLSAQLGALVALEHAPGVVEHSGPYPVVDAVLRTRGLTAAVEAQGRDRAPASVD